MVGYDVLVRICTGLGIPRGLMSLAYDGITTEPEPVEEALAATATTGERLLSAAAAPEVHQQMRYAVSEAHRLAGWASGDVGLIDHCRYHMHKALDFAAGSPERVSATLCSAADMEKHHGDANDALKFFQLAETGVSPGADPQAAAVLAGLSASAYLDPGTR